MSISSKIRKKQQSDKTGSTFLTRILDPIDRMSETIFSILIVLIFTLAYRGFFLLPIDINFVHMTNSLAIFRAASGAVIAWGMIDAIMYAIISVFERRDRVRFINYLQTCWSDQAGLDLIADEFDYIFEPITDESQRKSIYTIIHDVLKSTQPKRIGLEMEDMLSAGAVFISAIVAVIPSLLPLVLFRENITFALSLSNLMSFVMLFITGYRWGKYSGYKPLVTGLIVMSIAVLMVLLAIPLGG